MILIEASIVNRIVNDASIYLIMLLVLLLGSLSGLSIASKIELSEIKTKTVSSNILNGFLLLLSFLDVFAVVANIPPG